ncbi:unnamed protein product [Sphenostylis stenocarpa]|uniref:Uncharacterized protein n=1 Tax=Sphenostylis stenocarpa TaxID=92480 RepID=A0AA86S6D2_9FABA|nr:unnamed protein product [Sphenostylis stenocarpa]
MDANATSKTQTKSISNLLLELDFTGREQRVLPPVTSKQFADPALLWTPTTTLQLQDSEEVQKEGIDEGVENET